MKLFEYTDDKTPLKSKNLIDEIVIYFAFSLLVALIITSFYTLNIFNSTELINLTYSQDKYLEFSKSVMLFSISFSFVDVIFYYLILFFIKASGNKPVINLKFKNLIFLFILSLFGNLAFIVMSIFFSSLKVDDYLNIFISSFLVNIYCTFIYKLYLENMTYSNHLFWEIFRFAIVGLVAAVFDFIISFIFQFLIFKNNTASYVTIISTFCGFVIGVIINYLLSTYMVYKNATNNDTKSIKSIIIFVALAIIGLLLGMLLQFILYDLFYLKLHISFFTYPLDFVIRTLIVMVYNYLSRKIFIYK